jgi:hypothetical protein
MLLKARSCWRSISWRMAGLRAISMLRGRAWANGKRGGKWKYGESAWRFKGGGCASLPLADDGRVGHELGKFWVALHQLEEGPQA